MSASEAARFLAAVDGDAALAARIEPLRGDPQAVHALVRKEGFDCTADEIKAAFLDAFGAKMTPEQLDAVAAGLDPVSSAVNDVNMHIAGGVTSAVDSVASAASAAV